MTRGIHPRSLLPLGLVGGAMLMPLLANVANASSHREAPAISEDPTVDCTDVYAFISPDGPAIGSNATVTLIANYGPFAVPAGPPNYYPFSNSALYELKIDNTGDAVEDIVYQWRFHTTRRTDATFLYNTGLMETADSANRNVRQFYSLTRVNLTNGVVTSRTVLGTDLVTAPPRIGPRSNGTQTAYETAAAAANHTLGTTRVFAGPRDEGFYVDVNAIFDLLNISRSPLGTGPGVDATKGFNVNTLAIQVPVSQLTANGSQPTASTDANAVIGVWTAASRRKIRVLSSRTAAREVGPWVQVSRLGLPLINEVVNPLAFKDQFSRSQPKDDLANIAGYVVDPELSRLLAAVHGLTVPPTPRTDMVTVISFFPGALTSRTDLQPADLLRLNVAIAPVTSQNRLGVIAGDNAGFPNGRRVGDDVVDILERVVGGGILSAADADANTAGVQAFSALSPNNALADGVDANDVAYLTAFPYLGTPHEGYIHSHDP